MPTSEIKLHGGRELPAIAVTEIPPLPQAVLFVLSTLRKPGVSAEEVARALGSDQSIALRLMSIANSAFFGAAQRVNTLTHCVAWLGLDFVGSTLVTLSLNNLASDLSIPGFNREAFWRHSIAVATCSEIIAGRIPGLSPGEAYLAGLVHDLGKLIFALSHGEEYGRCLQRAATTGSSVYEVEVETLDLDHALVGASAMREWRLSPELVFAVLNHHEEYLVGPQSRLVYTLTLAQGVTGMLMAESGSLAAAEAEARQELAKRHLQLDKDTVYAVTEELQCSLEETQTLVMAMTS